MREQVKLARRAQAAASTAPTRHNAHMTHRQTRQYCQLGQRVPQPAQGGDDGVGPFGPAHDKVLRVARTIADMDTSDTIRPHHLNEAINYRDVGPTVVDVRGGARGRGPGARDCSRPPVAAGGNGGMRKGAGSK